MVPVFRLSPPLGESTAVAGGEAGVGRIRARPLAERPPMLVLKAPPEWPRWDAEEVAKSNSSFGAARRSGEKSRGTPPV
jgi:hypothetical protein